MPEITEETGVESIVSWKEKFSIVLLGALGAVVFNLLPLFIGAASDSLNLDHAQAGLLGSAYLAGYGAMIASGIFWVDRLPWRAVLTVALVLGAGLFFAITRVEGFAAVAALVIGCGMSLGTVYGLGYPAIARLPNPERLIGAKIAAEGLLGAILLFSLPGSVIPEWGFSGLMTVLGSVCLLGLFLVPSFPSLAQLRNADSTEPSGTGNRWVVLVGMGSLALYTAGFTGLWAFVERLGVGSGFTAESIGMALGLSLIVAVVAAFLAAAKGDRGSQILPHVVALVGFGCAVLLWLVSNSLFAYVAGVLLINATWFFVFPFQQALATRAAASDSVVMLVPAMSAFGAAAGPGLAGALQNDASFLPIFSLSGAMCLVAFLGFRMVLRQVHKRDTGLD